MDRNNDRTCKTNICVAFETGILEILININHYLNINQRYGVTLNSKGLHSYLDMNLMLSHIQEITNQYNTIQYNTMQYNTMQYNTIQYNSNKRST